MRSQYRGLFHFWFCQQRLNERPRLRTRPRPRSYGQGYGPPISGNQEGRWKPNDAVQPGELTLWVENEHKGQAEFLGILLNTVCLLTKVDPHHREALGRKILVQTFEQRHLRATLR